MSNRNTYLLKLSSVSKSFPIKKGYFRQLVGNINALKNISCLIKPGSILGVCGESGSGKSTLSRLIMGLIEPDSGSIKTKKITKNKQITKQIIFQDPYSSMNPKKTMKQNLKLGLGDIDLIDANLNEYLVHTKLNENLLYNYPHQLSGGQLQRFAIVRALLNKPDILVCDEVLSSLDPFVQIQVLEILKPLTKQYGISMVFVSHDLPVLRFISDEVLILYKGESVEYGNVEDVFSKPQHQYTVDLIRSHKQLAKG
ncbi:ATP-binding cassette domain-containing protein [Chlamydiia bacterium]|nr:ATP-binding cassette domain-containing protein [Chlamydiia bacterium]